MYIQEHGGYSEIQLSELQPDGRFIVDVNDTTGQRNRKMYLFIRLKRLCVYLQCVQSKHTV